MCDNASCHWIGSDHPADGFVHFETDCGEGINVLDGEYAPATCACGRRVIVDYIISRMTMPVNAASESTSGPANPQVSRDGGTEAK